MQQPLLGYMAGKEKNKKYISSKKFVKLYDHCREQCLFSKHDCSIEIYVKGYRPIPLRL